MWRRSSAKFSFGPRNPPPCITPYTRVRIYFAIAEFGLPRGRIISVQQIRAICHAAANVSVCIFVYFFFFYVFFSSCSPNGPKKKTLLYPITVQIESEREKENGNPQNGEPQDFRARLQTVVDYRPCSVCTRKLEGGGPRLQDNSNVPGRRCKRDDFWQIEFHRLTGYRIVFFFRACCMFRARVCRKGITSTRKINDTTVDINATSPQTIAL